MSNNTVIRFYNHVTDPEYLKIRAAEEKFRDRSRQLKQKSREAYRASDPWSGKQLLAQSKNDWCQADALKRKAAKYVFRENNRGRKDFEIDLHGLSVKEAIGFLEKRIREDFGRSQKELWVITGRGKHSEFGYSPIMFATKELCLKFHLEHHVPIENNGIVVIDLAPKLPCLRPGR
ncbi:Smr domain-containing protein [Spathaspora sp. JA1]|nr:Smr domain-containing protein [Spathaspora sp. JA1]